MNTSNDRRERARSVAGECCVCRRREGPGVRLHRAGPPEDRYACDRYSGIWEVLVHHGISQQQPSRINATDVIRDHIPTVEFLTAKGLTSRQIGYVLANFKFDIDLPANMQ